MNVTSKNTPRSIPTSRSEDLNPFVAMNPLLNPSVNPFASAFEMASAPMKLWSDWMGASMQMFSPLGYGAMRGPLGY